MVIKLKKIVAFILSIVIAITAIIPCSLLKVSASASSRTSAMIQFFQNQSAEGLTNNITEQDLRLFGIFLSNFYIPFDTNVYSDIEEITQNACAYLMGYSSYTSMTSENQEIVNQFVSKLKSSFDNSYYLYSDEVKGEDGTLGGKPVTVQNWLTVKRNDVYTEPVMYGCNNDPNAIITDTAKKDMAHFFNIKVDSNFDDTGDNMLVAPCNTALMLVLQASMQDTKGGTALQDYLNKEPLQLMITPFGDIVDSDGIVIVPGCLNPYTFSADGHIMPLNNAFATGSFITRKTKLKDIEQPYFALVNSLYNNSSSVAIYGLDTKGTVGDVSTYGGSYTYDTSVIGKTGIAVSADTSKFSNTMQASFLDFLKASFANETSTDEASIRELMGNIAFSYYTDIEDVMQEIYLFDRAQNGSYAYTDAVKVNILVGDDNSYKDSIDSRTISLQKVNEPSKFTGAPKNFCTKEDIKGYASDDFSGALSLTERTSVALGGIKTTSYISALTERYKNIHKVNLTLAPSDIIEQYYGYRIILPSEDVGSELNNNAQVVGEVALANTTNFWAGIFYAYMMRRYNTNLPDVDLSGLNDILSSIKGPATEDELNKENARMANELMKKSLELTADGTNDAKGDFLAGLIDSFILKNHRKMLGITSKNIATVSNSSSAYSGFTGHVTIPRLQDLPFTASLVNNYRSIYVGLMLFLFALILITVIMNMRSIRQGIATLVLLGFALALPPSLIDFTVTGCNKVTETMYADRFNYWALLQHQQHLQNVADAGNSAEDVLMSQTLQDMRSYYTDTGVQLRWMSAKKGDIFENLFTDSQTSGEDQLFGLNTFKWLFSGYLKQESYSADPLATYVYRSYSSLAETAKDNYEAIKNQSGAISNLSAIEEKYVGVQSLDMEMTNAYGPSISSDFMYTVPLSDSSVANAITNNKVSLDQNAGLQLKELAEDDKLTSFLLYSESPYYYFYNVFKSTDIGGQENFTTSLLSDEMFKVTEGGYYDGQLKDFMGMEALFTYVVPYMEASNTYVVEWTNKYGTDVPEYAGLEGASGVAALKKQALEQIWNMYAPWVDSLYEANSKSVEVYFGGNRLTIADTLNPYSYSEQTTERVMVFSPAEQLTRGLTASDLTETERKIQKVLQNTYTDLRYLTNYVAFDDEVLVTAAAMCATFNFNKEFSDNNLMGGSTILYPQGYELKNFSYDAYLRLILLNSTGTSIMSTSDIYETVLNNTTGIVTGSTLLLNDAIAIYALPTCKLIFLIATLFLSVVLILTCFLQQLEKIPKIFIKVLIWPLMQFVIITVIHAYGTATLMGTGLTEFVGSKSASLVTNDPTISLVILTGLNLGACIMYIRVLFGMLKSSWKWGKSCIGAIKEIASPVVDFAKDKISSTASNLGIVGKAVAAPVKVGTAAVGTTAQVLKRPAKLALNTTSKAVTTVVDSATDLINSRLQTAEQNRELKRAAKEHANLEAHSEEIQLSEGISTPTKHKVVQNKVVDKPNDVVENTNEQKDSEAVMQDVETPATQSIEKNVMQYINVPTMQSITSENTLQDTPKHKTVTIKGMDEVETSKVLASDTNYVPKAKVLPTMDETQALENINYNFASESTKLDDISVPDMSGISEI